MRTLQELTYVLSRNKIKNIRKYGFLQDDSGRLMQFYNAILDEKFKTDEEAAMALLNTSPKDKTYRRLKNKLKEELLNALFFVDTSQRNYSDMQKAYYEYNKEWAMIKILQIQSTPTIFLKMSENLISNALKYEFTELIFDVSRLLKLQYSGRIVDKRKYIYYRDLANEASRILQLELKVENDYNDIVINFAQKKSSNPDIFPIAQKVYKEIEEHLGILSSFRFNLHGYLIGVFMYMSRHDYQNTIIICEKALHYFDNRPYDHRVAKQAFLNQLTVCCTQLKFFKKGEVSALRSIEIAQEGKSNWHRAQESYLILLFHQGKYEQAYQVFQTARNHKSYKFLIDLSKERWQIYEAYIGLLYEMNQVGEDVTPNKKFKISKFLNEVPIFSKDKRGYNIPIIIIQFLFLVKREKYDEALQRMETLEKYGSRYLKNNDTFRTSCFIKMLAQLPKQGYQKKAIQENVIVLLEKLNEVPLEIADQANEIEVIPYEMLWELVLELL